MNAEIYIEQFNADFELLNIHYNEDGVICFEIESIIFGEDGKEVSLNEYEKTTNQNVFDFSQGVGLLLEDKAARYFDAECGNEAFYI